MTQPGQGALLKIDAMLQAEAWPARDREALDPSPAPGPADRELSFTTADPGHILVVDGRAIGIVGAKPEGQTLAGVATQPDKTAGESRKPLVIELQPSLRARDTTLLDRGAARWFS